MRRVMRRALVMILAAPETRFEVIRALTLLAHRIRCRRSPPWAL